MGGASSYLAILAIAGFLSAAWTASKLSKMAGVSSIVLEIATGVILGPSVLGLISDEYAMCEHKRHVACELPPDFSQRLKDGSPLGRDIGRIANMDYCDPHAYLHHDGPSHGDSGHGEDHGQGDTHEHMDAVGTVGTNHTAGAHQEGQVEPGPEPEPEPAAPAGSYDANHSAQHIASAVQTAEAPHSAEAHGEHRRLGGGGGASYGSYEECLVKSCEADVSHHCGLTPDVFTLIGHAGVALMIFESGMHFDFERAMVVGPKACVVAVLGTVLPLISGMLLTVAYGKPVLPDSISVGTALAPTSVGIALRLLGEAGVLQQDFGQAIITAAFVDDILSLVLFNVLFSLRGDFDVVTVVVFPILGIAFMGIAMVAAVKFWPRAINDYILPRIPIKKGEFKVSSADEGLFVIMFALLVVYATITHFLGTHLWGCFIAGMSFACVKPLHHPHHVWVKQTKRITSWMIRIFFAATVAFSIPVSKLLSLDAFLKGSLMGIGPCILTKVLCAPFMGDAKFVIGWAMVGRAEFAYLIAQMAAAAGMIDEETFSICIWALLYATIFAPFIFRTVLNRYIARHKEEFGFHEEDAEAEEQDAQPLRRGGLGHVDSMHFHKKADSAGKLGASASLTGGDGPRVGVEPPTTYGSAIEQDLEGVKLSLDAPEPVKPPPEPVKPAATFGTEDKQSLEAAEKKPKERLARQGNGMLCCLFLNPASLPS